MGERRMAAGAPARAASHKKRIQKSWELMGNDVIGWLRGLGFRLLAPCFHKNIFKKTPETAGRHRNDRKPPEWAVAPRSCSGSQIFSHIKRPP
jgi:hypothetical protein